MPLPMEYLGLALGLVRPSKADSIPDRYRRKGSVFALCLTHDIDAMLEVNGRMILS